MAAGRIVDVSRAQLRALVAIHRAMFDKLLDGDEDPVSDELIALFKRHLGDLHGNTRDAPTNRRRRGSTLEEQPQGLEGRWYIG